MMGSATVSPPPALMVALPSRWASSWLMISAGVSVCSAAQSLGSRRRPPEERPRIGEVACAACHSRRPTGRHRHYCARRLSVGIAIGYLARVRLASEPGLYVHLCHAA